MANIMHAPNSYGEQGTNVFQSLDDTIIEQLLTRIKEDVEL